MSASASGATRPRVTVIMRARNSDWVIGQALAGLFSQTFTEFDLLIVDSGSTDRTRELAAHYPHRLMTVSPGDHYPGMVLNRAITEGAPDADLIVFLNSDCVPLVPESLARLLAAFDDPAVDAAFARQIPRPEAEGGVRRDYAEAFPAAGDTPRRVPFSLPFAAMRRSAWEAHPFHTDAWGSEDSEWGLWARRSGRRVVYVPDALVMHSHNDTLQQIYDRRFREGEAGAFLYRHRGYLFLMPFRFLASIVRDAVYLVPRRDAPGLLMAPVRRAVYQWGYVQGLRQGDHRRQTGDRGISVG